MTEPIKNLFRQEAITHHNKGALTYGDILKLSPRWVNWAYPFVLLTAILLGLFLYNFSVDELVSGSATLQITGALKLAVDRESIVCDILASPGQVVQAGATLLRLAPSEATDEDLDDAELIAPADGRILEVSVAPGQKLQPGIVAFVMSDSTTEFRVTGLLPGEFLPRVSLLNTARFEIPGQENLWHEVKLHLVGNRLLSPQAAAAATDLAGTGLVDGQGPCFLVAGELPARSFLAAEQNLSLRDGLVGRIEVKIDSEPLIDSLIPALKMLKENRKRSDSDS